METPPVAQRYVQTLYDYAVEEDARDAVRTDCKSILKLLGSSSEFATFVENPTIPPAVAADAVTSLFEKQAHVVTLRFLCFLAAKGRLNLLADICEVYEQQACEDLGILKVKIFAAQELSATQLAAMCQKLEARYNKTIDAAVDIDPSLIGGFKIQVGDQIRDFSLLSKLDQFEQRVFNAKHEHSKYKAKSWR